MVEAFAPMDNFVRNVRAKTREMREQGKSKEEIREYVLRQKPAIRALSQIRRAISMAHRPRK